MGYTVLPAITIGLIDIQRIESNLTDVILTGRYGLTPRVELEMKVPYITANTTTETRPLATASVTDSFFDSSGSGIGDVEVAARAQLNHFHGDNVVWIGSLRYKSHTGTDVFQEPLDANTGLQTRLATVLDSMRYSRDLPFSSPPIRPYSSAAWRIPTASRAMWALGTVTSIPAGYST